MTRNRIAVEARRIAEKGLPLRPISPLRWQGKIRGKGTWAHQVFDIEILLPTVYPIKPPIVKFLTEPNPRHPNISPNGYVCLNHLLSDWKPTMTLESVLDELEWLFTNPNYSLGFVPAGYVERFGNAIYFPGLFGSSTRRFRK